MSFNSGSTTYVHNGQGQRFKKNNGAITLFAYGEGGALLGDYASTGTAISETVWFNGAPAAVLAGTAVYYVHTDHLGTPRVVTDGNTVIWRWDSDPFGLTAPDEDPDGNSTTFTYNLRLPGQYYDVESGLYYNYYRTDDPSTGRYLESDPIGLQGGLNTYAYAYQNPLRYTDPTGELVPVVAILGKFALGAVIDIARQRGLRGKHRKRMSAPAKSCHSGRFKEKVASRPRPDVGSGQCQRSDEICSTTLRPRQMRLQRIQVSRIENTDR